MLSSVVYAPLRINNIWYSENSMIWLQRDNFINITIRHLKFLKIRFLTLFKTDFFILNNTSCLFSYFKNTCSTPRPARRDAIQYHCRTFLSWYLSFLSTLIFFNPVIYFSLVICDYNLFYNMNIEVIWIF